MGAKRVRSFFNKSIARCVVVVVGGSLGTRKKDHLGTRTQSGSLRDPQKRSLSHPQPLIQGRGWVGWAGTREGWVGWAGTREGWVGWVGGYKGWGGWAGTREGVGWYKGGGGVGGLVQGRGWVGWAGTRERAGGVGWYTGRGDKRELVGGCKGGGGWGRLVVGGEGGGYKAPQGKGWVAWMTAAARDRVGDGVSAATREGWEGRGGG